MAQLNYQAGEGDQPAHDLRGKAWAKSDVVELYRDNDVIVINKPAGLAVHGTPGLDAPTVASLFAPDLYQDGSDRAGIVHRLDRDTSGVIILARTSEALEFLQQQFKSRSVGKTYQALVWGKLAQAAARIELPIAHRPGSPNQRRIAPGGKLAISEYHVLHEYRDYSLLDVVLLTGRTHQIRVHFSYLGNPVVGDVMYSNKPRPIGLDRQFLHATELTICLPHQPEQTQTFHAPLASDLAAFLNHLS